MKRLLSLLGVLAAVATVLTLPPVRPASAAPPGCFCGSYENTQQSWVQASTCQGARDALRALGYSQVDCPDGHCARGLVLTADCHWDTNTGMWQVDGYVQYRCWWCDPS